MPSSLPLKTALTKAATGIEGLDDITLGGLPRGRTTLLLGGPGSGKTVLALQTLVNGAREHEEPGIFVAFEESADRIMANAATFGWDLPALQRRRLFFLDAQPGPDLVTAGGFDLQGLLAAIEAKVRAMGARRIVFDSIDVLLRLLNDSLAERREIERLHHWLLNNGLTAVITAKADETNPVTREGPYGFLAYMVDCAIALHHGLVAGVSQRNLRVLKYRGSSFSENASPLVIGDRGIELAGGRALRASATVTSERISSGIERLDTMIQGGYHRGASILVTGSPGTAKTTLGGAFADAACERGERVLFVSFDSEAAEIVRNLASVGIRLRRHVRSGRLAFMTARSAICSAEVHLLHLRAAARAHGARCLVIDPVSALAKQGNEMTAHSVVERLIDWAKAEGLTLLCSSLLSHAEPKTEGTPLEISTIADTWIHLSYVVHAGERNRALTIVKSRGTAHSNQVRELVLSSRGVTLADVYTAGGEVLMGALRWERERAERVSEARALAEVNRKRLEIGLARAELEGRVTNLRRELELKQAELDVLTGGEAVRQEMKAEDAAALQKLRRGDSAPSPRRKSRR